MASVGQEIAGHHAIAQAHTHMIMINQQSAIHQYGQQAISSKAVKAHLAILEVAAGIALMVSFHANSIACLFTF